MAQIVPLNWKGAFANFGGPLASEATDYWWARGGEWGRENRLYVFSAFCDGPVAADIEVRSVSHYRRLQPDGSLFDETHFEIHNKGSDAPVYYYFYMGWSDPINV
jgi:hypothetical protein